MDLRCTATAILTLVLACFHFRTARISISFHGAQEFLPKDVFQDEKAYKLERSIVHAPHAWVNTATLASTSSCHTPSEVADTWSPWL